MGSSDDFYGRDDNDFWKQNDDAFWNSDERYIRKDEYDQEFVTESQYVDRSGTYQEEGRKEKKNEGWNRQTDLSEDYKRYSRFVGKMAVIGAGIMIVSVLLTALYIHNTRSRLERKLIDLNYITKSHAAEEIFTVKNCDVRISDAGIVFGSDELWMPEGKRIIGVYIEAENKEYTSEGGFYKPYLRYGDGYYCYPIRTEQLNDMLVKKGFEEEDILPSYYIGSYGKDEGWFFFLVDDESGGFSFYIDETERDSDRIEYVRTRHVVDLSLNEWRNDRDE